MLNYFKLGFRDIRRIRVLVISLALLLATSSYIMISSTSSALDHYQRTSANTLTLFRLIPISTDLSNHAELAIQLSRLYTEDALSVYTTISIVADSNLNVTYLFGDSTFIKPSESFDKNLAYSYQANVNETFDESILRRQYPVQAIEDAAVLEDLLYGYTTAITNDMTNTVYLFLDSDEAQAFLQSSDYSVLASVMENTRVSTRNRAKIESFLNLADDSIFVIDEIIDEELSFVFTFLYPFAISSFVALILSMIVIMRGYILRISKELTLYLLNGSTIIQIIGRFSVFPLAVIILTTLILAILGLWFIHPEWFKYIMLVYLIFYIVVVGLMYLNLRRSNLKTNLVGE